MMDDLIIEFDSDMEFDGQTFTMHGQKVGVLVNEDGDEPRFAPDYGDEFTVGDLSFIAFAISSANGINEVEAHDS